MENDLEIHDQNGEGETPKAKADKGEKENPTTFVALIRYRQGDLERDGWVIDTNKGKFQEKLSDPRVLEVHHIFKGKKVPFALKNVVWF